MWIETGEKHIYTTLKGRLWQQMMRLPSIQTYCTNDERSKRTNGVLETVSAVKDLLRENYPAVNHVI